MVVDRADRVGVRVRLSIPIWLGLLVMAGDQAAAQAPARDQGKSVEGFGEARRGDVPEGTLEMMTPKTDEAIQNGLAWLARTQSADGSFGFVAARAQARGFLGLLSRRPGIRFRRFGWLVRFRCGLFRLVELFEQ